MIRLTRRPILPALLALAFAAPAFAQGEVNLYTHREPGLIKPLLDRFTAETGVKVNVVFAANGLAERMQSEGERSPADLCGAPALLTCSTSSTTARAVRLVWSGGRPRHAAPGGS